MVNILVFNIFHAKTQNNYRLDQLFNIYVYLSFPKKDAALNYTDEKIKIQFGQVFYDILHFSWNYCYLSERFAA